ncbi:hypothetical protein IFM89_033771 [Coptis chinensis]|uniref:Importin N-terminal domain-containing protein n=1 Tax=Coptis chinensis TaxID=261450 RepID=A0A835HNT2_9MAGN|nr:hypothetical protein IFM89_033771 [Coptis chinensis]
MEFVDKETFSQYLLQRHSTNTKLCDQAKDYLANAEDDVPNFGLKLLGIVNQPHLDDEIRLSAATYFKDHLVSRWAPSDTLTPLFDSEKEQIKDATVRCMFSLSSTRILKELGEGLAVIGKHQKFCVKFWCSWLGELVLRLDRVDAFDYISINGILSTANSIFENFSGGYDEYITTNKYELFNDVKSTLDRFAGQLYAIFLRTSSLIDSSGFNATYGGDNAHTLRPVFESQKFCCRIFYYFTNFLMLPELFQIYMNVWMDEFRKYLTTTYPVLENGGDGIALVDELRVAVIENVNLYLQMDSKKIQVYLRDFAEVVRTLLVTVCASSMSRNQLVVSGVKFMTTLSTSAHHILFSGSEILNTICNDLDTRRVVAFQLLKGIAINYKDQVTVMLQVHIKGYIKGGGNVEKGQEKDCAIYLAGASLFLTDLIDVESFFISEIAPELGSHDVNGFLMIKAGCLKFFTLFLNHLSKHDIITLMPHVVGLLEAKSNVVHSYAAHCIANIFLFKEEGGELRYSSSDTCPFMYMLMNNLFKALKFPHSEENPYVLNCISQVLELQMLLGSLL